jgi:hypothetical protein
VKTPSRTPSTHPCPGRCGQLVARSMIACRSCWYEVPDDLRNRFGRTRVGSDDRRGVALEIFRWFGRQP